MNVINLHEPQIGTDASRCDLEYVADDQIINLDANANAPTTPAIQQSVMDAMKSGASNPSSGHTLGEKARVILTKARDRVAALINEATDEDVFFTAGCTEANNTVLRSIAYFPDATLITTVVEHSSVLRPAEALRELGINLITVDVDHNGCIDLDHLKFLIERSQNQVLVSVQAANSETGVLQPIDKIAALIAGHNNVLFHSDIAQAYGKKCLCIGRPHGPDVVTISGHKIHAPMGIGAVIVAPSENRIRPLILGGGQENGRRSGTQSVPLIAGFGTAAELRWQSFTPDQEKMGRLRDRLESAIIDKLPDTKINGGGVSRLTNTSNMRFPHVEAMAMLANLDALGIMCSLGSACTNGRPEPSHVLMAMGLTESEAFSSVRFSVSPLNTEHEIDVAAAMICKVARNLRAY